MMRFAVVLTLTLVFLLDTTLLVQAGKPRGVPINGNNKKRRQMRMQMLRGLQVQQQETQGANGAKVTSIVIIKANGESTSRLDSPAATTTTSTTAASVPKGGMTTGGKSGGKSGGMKGGTTGARAEGPLDAPPVCLPNETLLFLNKESTFFCATPQRTEGPTGMESRLHVFGPDGQEILPPAPVTVTEATTLQYRTFCPDDQTMIFLQEEGKHVCIDGTVIEEVEEEGEEEEEEDFP